MKQSFGWMQSSLFSLYGDKLCNKKVQSAVARSAPRLDCMNIEKTQKVLRLRSK